MAISETVMSTDHKTQKESYTRRSAFFFFVFFCQLRSSCTRLLHLHETRNVHETISVCVCVCVHACVRMYIRIAVT